MKKVILTLIVLFAAAADISAMNLKEAFAALSNIPNVSRSADIDAARSSTGIEATGDWQIATAYNLGPSQISETVNAEYTILNQVPLTYMINGANNGLTSVFAYATPNADGTYDMLFAIMNGYHGEVVFMLTTVDKTIRDAIQNAKLTMQGASLTLIPENANATSPFSITISGPEH